MIFNKLFNRKCISVVLKDTSVAFYMNAGQRSDLVFSVESFDKTDELANFVCENKHIKAQIVLDLAAAVNADIEIPNIESADLQAALHKKLEPDLEQYKIVHAAALAKPEETDPTWKFVVTKLNPNKKIVEFIEYLIHEFDAVTGIYLPLDSTPLDVPALKKLNSIQAADKAVHALCIMTLLALVTLVLQKEVSRLNIQKQIVAVSSELQVVSNKYNEELKLHTQRVAALNSNKNLKKLYKVFKTEQYPTKVLYAIMAAKGSKLSIDRFVYDGDNAITMSIQYKADKIYKYSDYFNEADNLIDNLKRSLPHHKISFYRVPKRLYVQSSRSQIPIGIKILSSAEAKNDR